MKKTPIYALIDCNNFFASCERVFRPDLADKPIAVLSNNDGCIIARTNEVKAMGVPMGAPLFKVEGLLKQHQVEICSANFELYGNISQRIINIIGELAPKVEVYSIDESFIDLTDLAVAPEEWALRARARILKETSIPVSIGIGPSKTLAKAASEYAKKSTTSGVHIVLDDLVRQVLLDWLQVGDIWGIGRRLAPKLKLHGYSTAAKLVMANDKWIAKQLGIKGLTTVGELRGTAILPFDEPSIGRKTINRSRAFGSAVNSISQLESAVASFTAYAAAKLRSQQSVCGAVITYIRAARKTPLPDGRHTLVTISRLAEPTADTGQLINASLNALYEIYNKNIAYEKAGIVLIDIKPYSAWQLSLLSPDNSRDKKIDLMKAVDSLNKRFGGQTVWHAVQDNLGAKWHSKHQRRSPAYTTSWNDLPKIY